MTWLKWTVHPSIQETPWTTWLTNSSILRRICITKQLDESITQHAKSSPEFCTTLTVLDHVICCNTHQWVELMNGQERTKQQADATMNEMNGEDQSGHDIHNSASGKVNTSNHHQQQS